MGTTPSTVHYELYIGIDLMAGEAVSLAITGLTYPRIGEELVLDGARGENLTLTVTEVDHYFGIADSTEHARVVVSTVATPNSAALARRLLDRDILDEWASHFPLVEPIHYGPPLAPDGSL
ncbi:hypothetical protein AB0L97_34585 [Nocardia sp. NPDC051911]|uniref:hypothetical protein n=1 Tax=Nocardia sp. NPDC051911 TaxID=3154648 RepID=UPI00343AECC6